MKKMFTKAFAFLLCAVMLATCAPLDGFVFEAEAAGFKVGDIVKFGSYPQSEVKDSALLSALNASPLNWVSYGYYSGTGALADGQMKPGNFMKYADIEHRGEKYRAVTFSSYRPSLTRYPHSASTGDTYQDDNGYTTGNVYWFKYEPLRWRVLDPTEVFLICESVIDAQPYSNVVYYNSSASNDSRYRYFNSTACTDYASDYETSSIRAWLNDDFYNTAFTSAEKAEIGTTTLDNSCYSSSYPRLNSASTHDKIFLLSYNEAQNTSYGFSSSSTRYAYPTAYAKAQGVYVYSFYGTSNWCLRSPGHSSDCACIVDDDGCVDSYAYSAVFCTFGIRPALVINPGFEAFDTIKNKGSSNSYDISFPVYALSNGGSQTAANGAEASIYIGTDRIAKTYAKNGVASFKKSDFSSRYDIDYIKKNATVSAHLRLDNGLELCSEEVKDNGQWAGAKLSDVISGKETLVTDEPRWSIPLMKVMVNESDVDSCKKVLRDYSSLFAQATNGHVIVNNFEIVTVPNKYKKKTQDTLKKLANDNGVDICMVRHSDTSAWSTVGDYSFTQPGSLDTIYPGCAFSNPIIWCPINASDCAKTLCHESGHYLLGLLDEYASAIGRYEIETGSCQNPKGYPVNYVYDKNRNGKIGMTEKLSAYWKNNGGAIERPSYAPSNFGLMENQAKNIEMSRSSSYSGVNKSSVQEQTLHYYASQASCEEKMAWLLDEQVSEYAIKYSYAKQTQTASYFYAGGDNVTFSNSNITTNGLLNQFEIITNSETDIVAKSVEYFEDDCNFSYSSGNVYIISSELSEVVVYDVNDTEICRFELNSENNYTNSFSIEPDSSYSILIYRTIDGVKYYNEYSLDVEQVNSATDISGKSNTINLFADAVSNAIVVSRYNNGESIVDGYTSLAYEYNIYTENATEVNGYLEKSVEYNLDIDYSSMTWFYKTDGEWTALETSIGTAEHGEPTAGCSYVGDGTYCLMAKSISDTVYSTPTELTVTNTDTIYDNDVTVMFTDSNENVLHYNVYYGTEPITAENCENMNVYVADSTQATVSLEDSGTTYYFAVQSVGADGGKSELSECVSCTGALLDSDSDGLPDYWIDMYPTLVELDDITGIDSDEDGLDNLKEYELGTDPLNPDTDGDNVYDGIELENSLDPLNLMSDGTTDDYVVVYGTPDPEINTSSFAIVDDIVTCSIENNTNSKAMRTSVNIYDASGNSLEFNEVNLDSNGYATFNFSKEYLVEGMRIVLDEDKITRDNDYSNNEFVYSPATAISTTESEFTLLKSANEQLKFICSPADASDIFSWESDNEKVLSVDNHGNIVCNSIGEATVTVTTSLGYSCSYNILVEPFKGAGLTDFDCQLINNDSEVEIIGYVGDETSIVIPPTIGNINVVSISADAFINQWDITAISIHSGITSIGEYAFGDCWNLIDVYYDGSRYCYKQIDIAPYNYALDYANIHYSLVPTTAKNNAVLDDESGLIYGLSAGIDSLEEYTNIELEGYYWEYTQAPNGFGTGTTALLTNGETVMDGYTVVIFGDINGDGWYDGEDAFLVNLIAKGMLGKDDVGEAIWTAADCNHDGAIDELDVDLLTGAGLKLNNVDQSKTVAELSTNSDYIEYVMLIDQSAGMNPGIAPNVENSQQGTTDTNTTHENPADEINIEEIFTFIFDLIKKLVNFIFSFVIN